MSDKYSLNVSVRGKAITKYTHESRTFIEGRRGSDFTLEFRNLTNERVLVVPSVDGLSTLDGKPATPDSPGYVVKPHGTLSIPGWTLDNNAVAKFQFQDKERSYTQSVTGSTTNAGVIGVAVFAENKPPVQVKPVVVEKHIHHYPTYPTWGNGYYPYGGGYYSNMGQQLFGISAESTSGKPRDILDVTSGSVPNGPLGLRGVQGAVGPSGPAGVLMSATATANAANTASAESFAIGTGWGSKADFKVTETTFDKGGLVETIEIYYDSRRNLEKRGIQVTRRERGHLDELPQAFSGFGCKPPSGWKG